MYIKTGQGGALQKNVRKGAPSSLGCRLIYQFIYEQFKACREKSVVSLKNETVKKQKRQEDKKKGKKTAETEVVSTLNDGELDRIMVKHGFLPRVVKEPFLSEVEKDFRNKDALNKKGGAFNASGNPRRLGFCTRVEFVENKKEAKESKLPYLVTANESNSTVTEVNEDAMKHMSEAAKTRQRKEAAKKKRAAILETRRKQELKQAYENERKSLRKRRRQLAKKKDAIFKEELIKTHARLREEDIKKMKAVQYQHSQEFNHQGAGADIIRELWQKRFGHTHNRK